MQGKSNSFQQVTPFVPRSGILASTYVAFPLDIVITLPSNPGCMDITPAENFESIKEDVVCIYELPPDMADAAPFFQGFTGPTDYVDPLWTLFFYQVLPTMNPGYDAHSGNMFITEDGKKIVVWGTPPGEVVVLVLTRNPDNSFGIEQVNDGGGVMDTSYTMSRDYILAGAVDGQSAVWTNGYTSPPVLDPDVLKWDWITADGTRLFGSKTNGDVIERTIGGDDVVLLAGGGNFSCVDYCGETAIINGDFVFLFKKTDGVWDNVGQMADQFGDPDDYPSVTVMSGDGTIGFGFSGSSSDDPVFRWDLTETGVISAELVPQPDDICDGCDIRISGMASDKSVVVGYYVTNANHGQGVYWLACDNYQQPYLLDDYFINQGLTDFNFLADLYSTRDIVVCSANGTHFVARSNNEGYRGMYYVAVPTPPCMEPAPFGFGATTLGELGFPGDITNKLSPTAIPTGVVPEQFAAGEFFSLMLGTDGTLWSTGLNSQGSLGLGDLTDRDSFTQVGTDTDWVSVACCANGLHASAMKGDGTLFMWGENGFGQCGNGNTTDQQSPVQIGTAEWRKVRLGGDHTLGIKTDGTLWAWGRGANGRLGLGGTASFNTPQQVGADADWEDIAGGDDHSLGIKSGQLWAWGRNTSGQLGNGTLTQELSPIQIGASSNWSKVYCLDGGSMGINGSGQLFGWGDNSEGQLGLGGVDTLVIEPLQVGSGFDWVKGACGERHTIMIKVDGTLWSTGSNIFGELGLGDTTSINEFAQVGSETTWRHVAAGESCSLAGLWVPV